MEGQHHFVVESDDMNSSLIEYLILGVTFCAVLVFVFKFIVADLPDNFLSKTNARLKRIKEEKNGRLRDHR